MSKYDRLIKENKRIHNKTVTEYDTIRKGIGEIAADSRLSACILSNPEPYLEEIDRKFEEITKLNKVDWAFLFFAVALQCVRQYFVTSFKERVSDQEAAKKTKGHNKEHSVRKRGKWFLPTCEEIIANPVPYDANRQIKSSKGALKGGGRLGHRLLPGHDPILGWFVGTANIATSTLTTWKFASYHIKTHKGNLGQGRTAYFDYISTPAKTHEMFNVAGERFFMSGKEGMAVLATALIKELIHLQSDVNTENSLPFPIVSTVSPELVNALSDYGLDMANILGVSKQVLFAEGINTVIEMLHGLFCYYSRCATQEESTQDEIRLQLEYCRVRTKRIVMWSNVIASSSNLLAVAGMEIAGVMTENPNLAAKGLRYLDVGGYLVTLHRLISDQKFINQIKAEFVMSEWEKLLVGDEYHFVKELENE